MPLQIIHMHEKLLHEPCKELPLDSLQDPAIQEKIAQMRKIHQDNPAVGMAAPQAGWPVRLFIIGIEPEHDLSGSGFPASVMINPRYEIIDDSKTLDWEGCFSVFNETTPKIHGQVPRYRAIRYQAFDERGLPVSGELEDYHARVFQHEADHLDGMRFVNRMTNANILFFHNDKEEYQIYMHQLPEIIRHNSLPGLRDLAPILLEAPKNAISKKLLQEIKEAYETT